MKKFIKFTIGALLGCSIVIPAVADINEESHDTAVMRNSSIFNSAFKELNMYYVDSIDANKSIKTALDAMLNDIDPYTEYIPDNKRDDFMVISTGEYGGIGSYLMQARKGGVYISEPYEDSPAYNAGLRAGDRIIKIDNDTVSSWNSAKISEKLKGQANTSFNITIQRPYTQDSIKTFNITRKKIKLKSVKYYGVVKDNIGYILLDTFNENSPSEIETAIRELKKNPNVKCLALDLRGNGGGLLESAVKIVGFFTPKGTVVVKTRGKDKQSEKVYKTTEEPLDTKIPLFVYIDGSSASASEIVSGSLQDLDRAVIIGARSYGKGLVQSTRPLPYGGLIKVTIAKYYIPSGRLIQAIDYSHRNEDGSVARTPDSLTNVYKTIHNREVRDGGGITPDIKIEYPNIKRITYNIMVNNWAFNYATKFVSEHPVIPAPEKFEITDSVYNDFVNFIDPDKFEYDKTFTNIFKSLKDSAKLEGYSNDSINAEISKLENMFKPDLKKDLYNNRKELSDYLATEIIKRYYFSRGEAIQTLKTDKAIDSTLQVINEPGKYAKLLNISHSPAKKPATKKKK